MSNNEIIFSFPQFRNLYNKVIISSEVISVLRKFCLDFDFSRESGGVVIGKFNATERAMIVTDISFPYIRDIRLHNRFKRSTYGHQKFMDEKWVQSGLCKTYLGEWHTHDEDTPKPSFIDIKNWIRISNKHKDIDLIFIIIGRKVMKAWTIYEGELVELL